VLEDHGVEEADDGVLVVGVEAFEGAEAVEEAGAVEGDVLGPIAGEQVVEGGAEGLGELDERFGGRGVEAALVLVELREADSDLSGQLLLGPALLLAQLLEACAEGLEAGDGGAVWVYAAGSAVSWPSSVPGGVARGPPSGADDPRPSRRWVQSLTASLNRNQRRA